MNHDETFSDARLQRFIDDETGTLDRAEIMEAVRKDKSLAVRICELLQVKDSVRLAYREPPLPEQVRTRWQASGNSALPANLVAAVLLFALGGLSGWALTNQSKTLSLSPAQELVQIAPATDDVKRVIFHISTADPARLGQALDDVERLLSGYRDEPEKVQLEVITNSHGLTLLRKDASPYVERIRRMVQEFDNLNFMACSRTIEKLHLKGIEVHLVPEAKIIPAALEQIVDHLQEGWVYIRV